MMPSPVRRKIRRVCPPGPFRHHSNHRHISSSSGHHPAGSSRASDPPLPPFPSLAEPRQFQPPAADMALRQAAAQAATLLRLNRRTPSSLWVRAISTTHFAFADEVRQGLHYAESHEWVKVEGDIATIGISDHAQKALGDIVFVELPNEGDTVTAGEPASNVESVKAVSDIFSPVSGTIAETNKELVESPETINDSPYDKGWFMKVKIAKENSGLDKLLSPEKYAEHQDADH